MSSKRPSEKRRLKDAKKPDIKVRETFKSLRRLNDIEIFSDIGCPQNISWAYMDALKMSSICPKDDYGPVTIAVTDTYFFQNSKYLKFLATFVENVW